MKDLLRTCHITVSLISDSAVSDVITAQAVPCIPSLSLNLRKYRTGGAWFDIYKYIMCCIKNHSKFHSSEFVSSVFSIVCCVPTSRSSLHTVIDVYITHEKDSVVGRIILEDRVLAKSSGFWRASDRQGLEASLHETTRKANPMWRGEILKNMRAWTNHFPCFWSAFAHFSSLP